MTRKKKNNAQQQKQEFRHQQNEFFKKLKHTMALIGDEKAFDMIDKPHRAIIHHSRIRPYKIVHATDADYPGASYVRELNLSLSQILNNNYIEVGENKIKFSLYDFSVYVETIHLICRNIDNHNPKIAAKFKACFPVFNNGFEELRLDVYMMVRQYLLFITLVYSRLTQSVLRLLPVEHRSTSYFDNSVFRNDFAVEHKIPVSEPVELKGEKRSAYRVWLNIDQTFKAHTIPSGNFGITGVMEKFPLQVYIQQHAVDRISERLSGILGTFNYVPVVGALTNDPILCPDSNGFLFPLKHGGLLLGYLKGDIAADK